MSSLIGNQHGDFAETALVAGIPLSWLREIDQACDAFFSQARPAGFRYAAARSDPGRERDR